MKKHDYIKIEINKEFTNKDDILEFLEFIKEILKETDKNRG